MDICRVIQDLLLKNERVSVPALGTFTLSYIPAQLYKFTNRVAPPACEIGFTADVNITDNSLISVLSQEYDMTENEAANKLQFWVESIISKISNGETYQLKDIGSLKKESNVIIFQADKESSLLASNFGLETTNLPLFEIEDSNSKPQTPTISAPIIINRKPSKLKKFLVATFLTLFIAAGLIFIYDTGLLDVPIKFFVGLTEPSAKSANKQLATNDTLTGKIDANELKRTALLYKERASDSATSDSKKKIIKYYLVAGSFKALKNAETQRDEMIKKGFTAEILNHGDTVYRVSLASFLERRKAVEEFIAFTNQYNEIQIWLFSQQISK